MSVLVVWSDADVMGHIEQHRGKLRFTYDESYRWKTFAFPLSLSMPLAAAEHPHERIDAFLRGLLPDNAAILDSWAKRFHVSAGNAFALLEHVGEDCAGAISLVSERRSAQRRKPQRRQIDWLTDLEIAERLRDLRSDQAAWRKPDDTGQFSLAGAQPKTALFWDGKRFGVPSGRTPTTHILKPSIEDLEGHAYNEHFVCSCCASSRCRRPARSFVASMTRPCS